MPQSTPLSGCDNISGGARLTIKLSILNSLSEGTIIMTVYQDYLASFFLIPLGVSGNTD